MAKRFRLRELEAERGDLHAVIPPRVNAVGAAQAARELGVSQPTISTWLKANGYRMVIRYERAVSAGMEQAS